MLRTVQQCLYRCHVRTIMKILALRDTELAVGQLATLVDRSPAAVSQHLAKLRLARMVATRQDGSPGVVASSGVPASCGPCWR